MNPGRKSLRIMKAVLLSTWTEQRRKETPLQPPARLALASATTFSCLESDGKRNAFG